MSSRNLHRHRRSGVTRDAEQIILSAVLPVVIAVLHFTGL